MASTKQIELFRRLTEDRDFGTNDVNELRQKFADLTDRNASTWIERALERPKRADGDEPAEVPAPF
jgi:hypothetical protein